MTTNGSWLLSALKPLIYTFLVTYTNACNVANCINCPGNVNYCMQCTNRKGGATGACVNCFNSRCADCGWDAGGCATCDSGYGHPGCNPCSRPQCVACAASYTDSCTACNSGYNVIGGYCIDVNCQIYSGGTCTSCSSGYGVSGGNCAACISPCNTCSSSVSICTACNDGYGVSGSSCVSCTSPCIRCSTNVAVCTACDDGYGVSGGSCSPCISPCNRCSTSISICTACDDGYGVSGSSCVSCTSPCIRCSTNVAVCTACDDGYGVSGSSCVSCTSPCIRCSTNVAVCTACDDGYGVSGGNCVPCADTNCLECSLSSTTCTLCDTLFGVSAGNCISCQVANCSTCGSDYTLCTACLTNTGLSGNTCVDCQDVNCLQCSLNYMVCTVCLSGFGLDAGVCVVCSDVNCLDCRYLANDCLSCSDGFGVLSSSCVPCDDNRCLLCSTDYANCTSCEPRYGVSAASCSPCSDTNCYQCSFDNTICQECESGYGLDVAGVCQVCNPSCLTCSPFDYMNCTSCNVTLYLSSGSCLPCISDCYLCSDGITCDVCMDGFYIDASNTCSPCPALCSLCFQNSFYIQLQCTACIPGLFELDHHTPPTCRELCGDSYTTAHLCDNQLRKPYDGCSDDCEIDPNFICEITPSFGTVCTYTGVISITFVEYKRSKTDNSFTLTLEIWPPLYILQTQNLKSLFSLPYTGVQIRQISFTPGSNRIQITSEISETITDPTFELQLHQSEGYNISLVSSFLFKLSDYVEESTIYHYPSIVFTISELIYIFSWVIMALGWIATIIGVFLRKLAGLQALFVIQICFFHILWLPSVLYPPFEGLYPLKYSTGYNPQLFANTISSKQKKPPHFKQMSIDDKFLINNFNVGLIALVISFIIVIVMFVRLMKKQKQIEYKEYNGDESARKCLEIKQIKKKSQEDRQKQQQEYQKVNNAYQTSIEWTLYISMVNVMPITAMSFLFFQKGDFTHIPSLLVFGFGVLIILFILIAFWRDPFSFGIFKNSFRATCLSFKYYTIQPFYLISIITLIAVPQLLPFLSLIPPTLHLFLLLLHKPYLYISQNYRQAFNTLTICTFSSMVVLASYQQNSLACYILLIISVCVLLPIILIWTFISMIWLYYFENYLLKEGNAVDDTEEDQLKKKVLIQLENLDVRKQVGKLKTDVVYKNLGSPKNSLLNISNRLKYEDEQQEKKFGNLLLQHGTKMQEQKLHQQASKEQRGPRKIDPQSSKPRKTPSYSTHQSSQKSQFSLHKQQRRKKKKDYQQSEPEMLTNNYTSIKINNPSTVSGVKNNGIKIEGYQSTSLRNSRSVDNKGEGISRQSKSNLEQYKKNNKKKSEERSKTGVIFGFDDVRTKNGRNVEPKNVIFEDSAQSEDETDNQEQRLEDNQQNQRKQTNINTSEISRKNLKYSTNKVETQNINKNKKTDKINSNLHISINQQQSNQNENEELKQGSNPYANRINYIPKSKQQMSLRGPNEEHKLEHSESKQEHEQQQRQSQNDNSQSYQSRISQSSQNTQKNDSKQEQKYQKQDNENKDSIKTQQNNNNVSGDERPIKPMKNLPEVYGDERPIKPMKNLFEDKEDERPIKPMKSIFEGKGDETPIKPMKQNVQPNERKIQNIRDRIRAKRENKGTQLANTENSHKDLNVTDRAEDDYRDYNPNKDPIFVARRVAIEENKYIKYRAAEAEVRHQMKIFDFNELLLENYNDIDVDQQ